MLRHASTSTSSISSPATTTLSQTKSLTTLPPEIVSHILHLTLGRDKGLEKLSEEGLEDGWAGWGGVEDPRKTGWVGEREEGRRIGSSLTWHSAIKLLLPVCKMFYELLLPKLWEAPTVVSSECGQRFIKALSKMPIRTHSASILPQQPFGQFITFLSTSTVGLTNASGSSTRHTCASTMARFWVDNLARILPLLTSLRRLALGDLVHRANLESLDSIAEAVGKAGRGAKQYGKGVEFLDVLDLAPLAILARGAPPSSLTESVSHTAALIRRTEFCFDLIGKCENLKRISCAGLVLIPNGAMEKRFRRVLELQRKCGQIFKDNIDWDNLALEIEESMMDFDLGDLTLTKGVNKPLTLPRPQLARKAKVKRSRINTDDSGVRDLFFGTACELGVGLLWDLPELAPDLKELHVDAWSLLYPSPPSKKAPESKEYGHKVEEYQAAMQKYRFLKDKTLDVGLLLERLSSLHLTGLTIGWGLSDSWGTHGGWKGSCDKILTLFPYLKDFEVRADFVGVGFWKDISSRTFTDKTKVKKLSHPLSYLGIHILPPHNPPPALTVDVFVYLSVPEIIETAEVIGDVFGPGYGWDATQQMGTGWFELLGRTTTLVEKIKKRQRPSTSS